MAKFKNVFRARDCTLTPGPSVLSHTPKTISALHRSRITMSGGGRRTGLDEGATGGVHFEVISTPVGAGAVNIFVICLDREGGEHNIIDRPFATGLARAVVQADRLAGRGLVDMVVLCSAKRGSFVAGADIKHQLLMIGEEGKLRYVTRGQSWCT